MRTVGMIFGGLLLIAATITVVAIQPGRSGVAGFLRLADGSEYMVIQHCNWSLEPYNVAFFMRPPEGKWGWCYIDHQANRWRDVALRYDEATDVVTITERGAWRAALDRKRGRFAIGDGTPKRELTAPQEYRDPEFPFP